jgi:hypothetical protein
MSICTYWRRLVGVRTESERQGLGMRTLFAGSVFVHYGQFYVESAGQHEYDLPQMFAGQVNGLCGAAVPGSLFFITGLHTGDVGLTIELHDAPPAVDDVWEEVVEASFRPTTPRVALVQWAGEASWDLDLVDIDYRVRYCASGMREARERDTLLEDEAMLDRYLVQFWPSAPAPDRVIKQTSEIAAYWHGHASGQGR